MKRQRLTCVGACGSTPIFVMSAAVAWHSIVVYHSPDLWCALQQLCSGSSVAIIVIQLRIKLIESKHEPDGKTHCEQVIAQHPVVLASLEQSIWRQDAVTTYSAALPDLLRGPRKSWTKYNGRHETLMPGESAQHRQ